VVAAGRQHQIEEGLDFIASISHGGELLCNITKNIKFSRADFPAPAYPQSLPPLRGSYYLPGGITTLLKNSPKVKELLERVVFLSLGFYQK
jgi:hypothetical protein